jgi:hypothetical protein
MPEYTGPQETTLQPDEDMMTDHLGSWFGNIMEGQIDIGWMNTERGGITNFKRFDVGDFDEAAAFAAKTNAVPGQSVYYRPAVVKPDAPAYVKDADVMIAPGVWVDLDDPGAVKTAKATYTEAGLPPTGVVVTGREPETRAHLYWAFTEYRGASDITKRMNQSICTAMGGDPASVNVSRLMRLGGTIAWPWKEGREPEMTSFKRINKGGPYADTRLKAAWPIEQPKLEKVSILKPYRSLFLKVKTGTSTWFERPGTWLKPGDRRLKYRCSVGTIRFRVTITQIQTVKFSKLLTAHGKNGMRPTPIIWWGPHQPLIWMDSG